MFVDLAVIECFIRVGARLFIVLFMPYRTLSSRAAAHSRLLTEGIRFKNHLDVYGAKRAFRPFKIVKACAGAYRHPWLFSHSIHAVQLTFCLQQHKVSTNSSGMNLNIGKMARSVKYRTCFIKKPLEGKTLHPIIDSLLQVVMIRYRRGIT